VYRGSLNSSPIASNSLGGNNTISGDIKIPTGQGFFVQWSAVGTNYSDASARVTLQKDDSPFDEASPLFWSTNPIRDLTIPTDAAPNTPRRFIGPDVPAEIQAYFSGGATPIAVDIFYFDDTHYAWVAYVLDVGNVPAVWVGRAYAGVLSTFYNYNAQTPGLNFSPGYGSFDAAAGTDRFFGPVQFSDFVQIVSGGLGNGGLEIDGSSFLEMLAGSLALFHGAVEIDSTGTFEINTSAGFVVDGKSMGRGFLVEDMDTANAAAIVSPASGFVSSCPAFTFPPGRAFRATFSSVLNVTVATQALVALTNGVGTVIVGSTRTPQIQAGGGGQQDFLVQWIFRNNTGGGVNTGMQVRLTPAAGTLTAIGAASMPRYLYIEDIGEASDHPNAPSL